MLTRVYGTAFFKQAELDAFLEQLELARARDHRKLGRELGLFTFSPLSPGSTFWLPKGTAVFNALVALNRRMQQERGYVEVKTPLLYESHLWETSGHWGKYKDNIFVSEYEEREFGLKPMNCPGHCALFGMQHWSYRDLPGALRRAGAAAPPRAQRHAARPHARASLHPGRRPHLLHRGADPGRGHADAGLRLRDLRHVRLPGARRALDAARRSPGRRCAVGPRRGGAGQGAREQRHRVHDRRGRGRLLRPQDRPAHDRLARALLAAGHRAARLQHARPLRAHLHRRRQRRAHPGDDAPRALRLLRALHRDPHRAHRRRAAAVAGAGAGDRAADRRPPQRRRRRGRRARCAPPACAPRSTTAPSRSGARSATPSCRRCPTCS